MLITLIQNPSMFMLVMLLLVAVYTDLNVQKIPNRLVLVGLIASLIGQCFLTQGAGGLNWLAGVGLGFICFIPLYILRGMAAGDVKLMAMVGGFLGYPLILNAVINVFIVGGVLALVMVLYTRKFKKLLSNMRLMWTNAMIKSTAGVNVADDYVMKNSAGRMPYALAIALGSFLAVYQHYSPHWQL